MCVIIKCLCFPAEPVGFGGPGGSGLLSGWCDERTAGHTAGRGEQRLPCTHWVRVKLILHYTILFLYWSPLKNRLLLGNYHNCYCWWNTDTTWYQHCYSIGWQTWSKISCKSADALTLKNTNNCDFNVFYLIWRFTDLWQSSAET